MDYILLIPTIVISMVIFEGISMVVQKKLVSKTPPPNPMPKPPVVNLLSELDMLIDLEIVGVVETPLMLKEIPLITDFKETRQEIIRNVVDSLSSAFYIEANKCGVKRAYVLTYITRRTHAKLLDFMKDHNYTLK